MRAHDIFCAATGADPELMTELINERYEEDRARHPEKYAPDYDYEWDEWFEEQRRKEWERLELLNEWY